MAQRTSTSFDLLNILTRCSDGKKIFIRFNFSISMIRLVFPLYLTINQIVDKT